MARTVYSVGEALRLRETARPFICRHADPRCEEDPCPWGIARVLCNAPADDPIHLAAEASDNEENGCDAG